MPSIVHFRDFAQLKRVDGAPEGWTTWTPRAEISPRFAVDAAAGRSGRGALKIDGNDNPAAYGAWRHTVAGIVGGRVYRFTAYYRVEGVQHERRCVSARLDWRDEKGNRARPPDYALDVDRVGAWRKVEHVAAAPDNARSVVIELAFGWCAQGAVWWDDIQLREDRPSPVLDKEGRRSGERVVRAMTIYHRPRGTPSATESVEQFCRLIESAASQKPDLICL
ncbi:MAG: hypothetical protein NZT92_07785, partial [Abditibacteriales bacterium]|nr:hypothetical protein [Abditibacteriales bacterium]MDW8365891.1 hypothetical protein [Abditibacteriales bacterium]